MDYGNKFWDEASNIQYEIIRSHLRYHSKNTAVEWFINNGMEEFQLNGIIKIPQEFQIPPIDWTSKYLFLLLNNNNKHTINVKLI